MLNYFVKQLKSIFHFFSLSFSVKDSKCDYPAACNAMETLLVDQALHTSKPNFLKELFSELHDNGVSTNLLLYVLQITIAFFTLFKVFNLTR